MEQPERTDPARLRKSYEQRRLQLMTPAEPASIITLPIFAGIPEKAREKVVEKVAKYMHFVEYAAGDTVIEKGAYSDSAYVIVNGAVEILMGDAPPPGTPQVRGGAHLPPKARPTPMAEKKGMIGRGSGTSGTVILSVPPADMLTGKRTILERGEIFGEISALSRYPVSATVRAEAPLRVLRIQLRGLKTLMQTSKEFKKFLDTRYRERALKGHLKQVELFSKLDAAYIDKLKDKVELLAFEQGQVIVQEGTPADAFFLVRGGYVKVAVRMGTSDLAVTYLRKGDYAGASGLLIDETWPFSLQALEFVEVVKLGKADLQELMAKHPALEDELWKDMMSRLKARGAVARNPTSAEHSQMAMDTGLIHGESVLLIDLSTCTRCDECVRGCSDAHGGTPRFVREGERYRNWLIPTACYQCTDPTCMVECPTGAITRESDSLVVTINPHDHPTRNCIGCGNCAERCPWGNIVMVPFGQRPDGKAEEEATKCDLCHTRSEGPACVQMCPHGSAVRISFREMEQVVATLK
jgi:CRP-like cAMP-binding protein/Fe-S-cluster-containing hydrogenase component 2